MIRAILRAQLLSMRTLRVGTRLQSAIFSTITGVLFYGFWAIVAFGAEAFFANPDNAVYFPLALPAALMVVTLYWQIAPVVSASLGASLDLKKLIVYPIPRSSLFVVEILLRITTCIEMMLALAGVLCGIALNPRLGGWSGAPRLVVAGLLVLAFNLFLAAGMRSLLERMLMRRTLREVFMLVIVLVGVLPQLLIAFRVKDEALKNRLPVAIYWPWGAAGHILLNESVAAAAAIALTYAAGAYFFSRYQFERGIRADAGPGTAGRPSQNDQKAASRSEWLVRLPSRILPDPLGAVVEKELLTLARSPRFRLVYIMGFSFGLAVWLPIAMHHGRRADSIARTHFLTYVCVYALVLLGQVTFWNCFGFDRSATEAWYVLPVPFACVLKGKNITSLIVVSTELVLVLAIALALPVPHSPGRVLEAVVVTLVCAIYLISIGNLTSVRLPRAMHPEKVTQGGAARSMNALAFFLFPVGLLPVGLAYWARYVFDSEPVFFGLLVLAGLLGAIVYWIALDSAVVTAIQRKELILNELARSDGPLSLS
jgi:ABC-2 type transport system permease protein